MNYALVVPTLNGGETWKKAAAAISKQTTPPKKILVIDSESTDCSIETAKRYGFDVEIIQRNHFDHGGTRQYAVEQLKNHDYIVFMTQDAIPTNNTSLTDLLKPFEHEKVAISYGRQLPHQGAKPIEAHARYFNYPETSHYKSKDDIQKIGIKAAFCSNSFAAYRTKTLLELGGFPAKNILSEDMYMGAKAILNGYTVAYEASALCNHSHDYHILEESRRMFDIGVFHQRNRWILDSFGFPEGEGLRFLKSELSYLSKHDKLLIPKAFARTLMKFIAYKIGYFEKYFDTSFKSKLSRNKTYWLQPNNIQLPE